MAIVLVGVSTYGQTLTGSRGNHELSFGKYEVDRVVFFESFDLGGDVGTGGFFVYTSTAPFATSTGAGGEVKTMRYTESMAVQINVPTLGSASIDWQVEGRFGTDSQYALIGTGTISAANVTTGGVLVNITSNPEALRVGLKPNTPGTDEVDVYALLRRLKQ